VLTETKDDSVRKLHSNDQHLIGAVGIRESTLTSDPLQGMSASNTEVGRLRALRSEPVVLRLRHVGKSYPIAGSDDCVVALKDITLAEIDDLSDARTVVTNATSGENNLPPPFGPVRRGEFVMIRGPSGGGKTTLLNIIGTIDACTEGTIELSDRKIDKDTKENVLADIRLKSLGFVFQTFNLIATMTAAENVELPMTLLGKLSNKEMRLRSRQLLTLVGLRNRINHLPSELSGGEQQRVTIARSLANNPSLLLLDEPTGDLDTANTIEIMDLLMRINRRTKTTCIMVTHNPDIECYADRILYVSDGRFGKEVYNTVPTCLNMEKYIKYLAEKEKQITGLTHINKNASCDAEDEGAAAPVGGSVVRLHRDSRANSSFLGSSHGSEVHPLPLQRQTSDALSEDASEIHVPLSRDTTGLFSKRSARVALSSPLTAATTPLGPGTQPAWRKDSPLAGTTTVCPPPPAAAAPALAHVVHREEKEAAKGM
jgi:putative ABC transport system ATP-binding protein